MRKTALRLIATGLITAATACAAESDDVGLAVGASAPAFELAGSDGRSHTLDEFLAKGKVALVFHRSADW